MRRTRARRDTARARIVTDRRAMARTGVVGDCGAVARARARAAIDGTRTGAAAGIARTGAAVNVTGTRAVAPGDGGAGSAGRARHARPVVRPAAPSDAAAVVAVGLGRLATAHAAAVATAGLGSLATAHTRRLAAADATAAVTATGLWAGATADAAVVVATGRRHLRSRPAVPRWGAVLRSRRVGRTTAGTTTLALCLKRGGTHHYDAQHQYHFYESFHFKNGVFGSWLKAKTGKRENRANHRSIQWIEGSRAHQVNCFLA